MRKILMPIRKKSNIGAWPFYLLQLHTILYLIFLLHAVLEYGMGRYDKQNYQLLMDNIIKDYVKYRAWWNNRNFSVYFVYFEIKSISQLGCRIMYYLCILPHLPVHVRLYFLYYALSVRGAIKKQFMIL